MLIIHKMKYIWILRRKIQAFFTVINETVVSPLVTSDFLFHSGSLLKVLFSPDLIVSRLSNVPDPGESLVSWLLDDLKEPYLDAWGGEIGDLVLHFNGRLTVDGLRFDGGEAETGSHQVFLKKQTKSFWVSQSLKWSLKDKYISITHLLTCVLSRYIISF